MIAAATTKSEATHAHTTTYPHNLEASTVTFNSDTVTFVMDNAATGHICNDKTLFDGPLSKDSASGVITANGVTTHMQGNVRLKWFDDEHFEHEHLLTEVHYIPSAPVNLFSVPCFTRHFMDDDGNFDDAGTCISSNYCNSTFSWNFGKYTRTFPNSKIGCERCRLTRVTVCLLLIWTTSM